MQEGMALMQTVWMRIYWHAALDGYSARGAQGQAEHQSSNSKLCPTTGSVSEQGMTDKV